VGWCLLMYDAGSTFKTIVAVAECCRFYLCMYDYIVRYKAKVRYI
jgi:hypothetical protein